MAVGRSFFTDIDRVFEDMTRGMGGAPVGFGAVDAALDVDSGRLTARFDLPGVDRDSLSVRVAGDALVVEALRSPVELQRRHKVLAAERSTGQVRRVFRTGLNLDADSVTARFEDGVLEVEAGTRAPGRTVQVSFAGARDTGEQHSIVSGESSEGTHERGDEQRS
ncbi:Hsp20/alpha crystallin family protein [Aquipuribacter nitratireducens]|uniref:Hsp20/alpha crystallin family protein n=1 Tax=Aquipuribacter nitratireducens TaxID=650104 RepID=A0ABW0GKA3_9MICO